MPGTANLETEVAKWGQLFNAYMVSFRDEGVMELRGDTGNWGSLNAIALVS